MLTNSLCLLCGAAEGLDTSRIEKILPFNGKENLGFEVIPNTLSMNGFRFDALLKLNREKYGPMILEEIDQDFGYSWQTAPPPSGRLYWDSGTLTTPEAFAMDGPPCLCITIIFWRT